MTSKSIILVENDINLRQSIALILQRAGYFVSATGCVNKALELLHHSDFHLLISDNNHPESSSVLLPEVSQAFPHLPIVILSDQSSAEAEVESKLFSAKYLVKPVAPEQLIDSVRSILTTNPNSSHSPKQASSDSRI